MIHDGNRLKEVLEKRGVTGIPTLERSGNPSKAALQVFPWEKSEYSLEMMERIANHLGTTSCWVNVTAPEREDRKWGDLQAKGKRILWIKYYRNGKPYYEFHSQ